MIDEQKLREVAGAAMAGNDIAYDILCEDLGSGVVILAMLDELATLRQERTAWRVTAENAEAAVKQARIDALCEQRIRYVRISYEGTHEIMTPADAELFLAEAKDGGDETPYILTDTYLSEREFDDLPEFDGF